MTPSRLIAVTAMAALGLTACSDKGAAGGKRLCTPFTTTANANTSGAPAVTAPADPSAAMDDCLHRWAYSLAASSDPADQVAQATVAACSSQLARWNQQSMAPSATGGANAPVEAPSLLTGEPTTPIAEHMNFAQGRALFYVVQARAGKGAPPPMTNGAPDGATK